MDNGSTDGSREIAAKLGARVVLEENRGYGSALLRGMREARGDYILFGDADNTYDFEDGIKLIEELEKGADFAIGDRINGAAEKGSMPWLHQHLGTPILTWVLNQFFGSTVHDINCGLRAIRRSALSRLKLRSPGMEFASEMVINAQKAGLKFAEVPIRYYVRRAGQAKLRTLRDGWRHLRFILLAAPFPLFFIPAVFGATLGLYFTASERLGFQVMGGGILLAASQLFVFGVLAKASIWAHDDFMVDRPFGRILEKFKLEYGILISLLVVALGVYFVQGLTINNLIRGAWFLILGIEIFFSSFLLSIILIRKRESI